ncbi:Exocyst complex component EXO70H1 [Linum grandiflorum]
MANCFSIPSPKRALSSIKPPSPSSSPSPFHFSPSNPSSTMDKHIQAAESTISKWDLNSSSITTFTSLFHHNRKDTKDFLKSILSLRRTMRFLKQSDDPSSSGKLLLCQKLMQAAMRRLEKEFHLVLSASLDLPKTAMLDLKAISDCMTSSGYAKECLEVYIHARKSVIFDACQSQRLDSDSESLEIAIKNWLNDVRVAVKTMFNIEKTLCEQVFATSDERTKELCFSEVVKEAAGNLFRFPASVALKSKNSKERSFVFPLMDLYEALFELWPEIESLFGDGSSSDVKQQAHSSMLTLAESVRQSLTEFESTFQKEYSSKDTVVPGGGIHPLTKSVMEFLSKLADYGGILSDIIADTLPECNAKLPESYYESPVSARLAWLVLVLLCKLDMKSEQYQDVSLSYLFLANNLQFIFEKVCTTRLRVILGEDWVFKHAQKLKKYAVSYEKIAWNRVFSALPSKPFPEEMSPEAAREHFFRFNAAFEKAHRKQAKWVVPNGNFRDALKVSIAKKLVPVYREFHEMYAGKLSGKKSLEVLVKYGPDDVELYLSDLFHGDSASDQRTPNSQNVGLIEGIVETRSGKSTECTLAPWKKLRRILFF